MEFEWDSIWLLFAVLVGLSPAIVISVKKAWKWYQRMRSGSNESLEEHLARIEKENEKK